jgi:hypothetical protein
MSAATGRTDFTDASNDGVTVVVFDVSFGTPAAHNETGTIMENKSAKLAAPEHSPFRLTSSLRGALIFAVFLVLLVANFFAQDAAASSPPQAQSTIPPDHADGALFDLYLPQVVKGDGDTSENHTLDDEKSGDCPTHSDRNFATLPVVGPPVDHPPPINADLNLSIRGYTTATVALTLIDINGPTDSDPPQLAGIVAERRGPDFVEGYHVNEWDWFCQDKTDAPWYGHGCRGEPITYPSSTLIAMATEPGVPIYAPARRGEIHAGGYVALVLYAEESRLTLAYTREDTPARGYVVHLEDFCVDASLLQLYQELDSAGRSWLPALHSLEQLGTGAGKPLKAAIRDTGSFMDPRSRKDWWQGH